MTLGECLGAAPSPDYLKGVFWLLVALVAFVVILLVSWQADD